MPESFLDFWGLEKISGTEFPQDTPNKFSEACSLAETLHKGLAPRQTVITSPLIYCSQNGTPEGSTILDSYVHEFCHFALYALQPVSLNLLRYIFDININTYEDFLMYLTQVQKQDIPPERKQELLKNAVFSYSARSLHEKATQLLTSKVLQYIGASRPNEWRGKPKEYLRIESEWGVMVLPAVTEGDPFMGIPDYKIFEGMLDWTRFIVPQEGNKNVKEPYIQNLIDSIQRNVREAKVPITELASAVDREKRRQQEGLEKMAAKKARQAQRFNR